MAGRRRKREGRVLFIDAVGGEGGALLAVVFRGGWVDCIAARRKPGGAAGASAWLESQGFLLEVIAVSLGEGLGAAWGSGEVEELRRWAASMGFEECSLGKRNASQAAVISCGIGEYLGLGIRRNGGPRGSQHDR